MGSGTLANVFNGQHIIFYFGALAAAIMSILGLYKWIWPKIKLVHEKWRWFMSDENDHAVIMKMLDEIKRKLEPNGGTHIPDQLKRIEHSVMFQGARQLASLHMNPNPVFETNHKGEVIFVNTAYKKCFGIDSRDAIGMGWVNIIDPDTRQEVVTKWFNAVKDRRAFDEYVNLIWNDGIVKPVHVIAYVIRGDGNEVLGHHGEVTLNGVEHDV